MAGLRFDCICNFSENENKTGTCAGRVPGMKASAKHGFRITFSKTSGNNSPIVLTYRNCDRCTIRSFVAGWVISKLSEDIVPSTCPQLFTAYCRRSSSVLPQVAHNNSGHWPGSNKLRPRIRVQTRPSYRQTRGRHKYGWRRRKHRRLRKKGRASLWSLQAEQAHIHQLAVRYTKNEQGDVTMDQDEYIE